MPLPPQAAPLPPSPSSPLSSSPFPRARRLLQELLPTSDIVKMVSAAPPLLCSDIEGSVARKLQWMREMVRRPRLSTATASPTRIALPLHQTMPSSYNRPLSSSPLSPSPQVSGTERQVDEKIESNPRLLTCGYGVVFGRLEFKARGRPDGRVPVAELRSILLTPVLEFDRETQVRTPIQRLHEYRACAHGGH